MNFSLVVFFLHQKSLRQVYCLFILSVMYFVQMFNYYRRITYSRFFQQVPTMAFVRSLNFKLTYLFVATSFSLRLRQNPHQNPSSNVSNIFTIVCSLYSLLKCIYTVSSSFLCMGVIHGSFHLIVFLKKFSTLRNPISSIF